MLSVEPGTPVTLGALGVDGGSSRLSSSMVTDLAATLLGLPLPVVHPHRHRVAGLRLEVIRYARPRPYQPAAPVYVEGGGVRPTEAVAQPVRRPRPWPRRDCPTSCPGRAFSTTFRVTTSVVSSKAGLVLLAPVVPRPAFDQALSALMVHRQDLHLVGSAGDPDP